MRGAPTFSGPFLDSECELKPVFYIYQAENVLLEFNLISNFLQFFLNTPVFRESRLLFYSCPAAFVKIANFYHFQPVCSPFLLSFPRYFSFLSAPLLTICYRNDQKGRSRITFEPNWPIFSRIFAPPKKHNFFFGKRKSFFSGGNVHRR